MDLVTLTLAKNFAAKAMLGMSNIEAVGSDIKITTLDGEEIVIPYPEAERKDFIEDVKNEDGRLIFTLGNGKIIDAGELDTTSINVVKW